MITHQHKKTMIKQSLILLILYMNSIYSQEKYKEVEGFYNLSSFEVASGIYLLEDQSFFYYSSFGNVDLKIYGAYSISDQNIISLKVYKDLLKEFQFYGLKNEKNSDNITLQYNKPYKRTAEKLLVNIDSKLINLPEFVGDSSSVYITLKSPKTNTIKIGYETFENESNPSIKKLTELHLDENVNDIKIFHNYYFDMTTEIARITFKIEDNVLTGYHSSFKKIKKNEISEKVKNEVLDYIEARKSMNSITRDGKVYQKL